MISMMDAVKMESVAIFGDVVDDSGAFLRAFMIPAGSLTARLRFGFKFSHSYLSILLCNVSTINCNKYLTLYAEKLKYG